MADGGLGGSLLPHPIVTSSPLPSGQVSFMPKPHPLPRTTLLDLPDTPSPSYGDTPEPPPGFPQHTTWFSAFSAWFSFFPLCISFFLVPFVFSFFLAAFSALVSCFSPCPLTAPQLPSALSQLQCSVSPTQEQKNKVNRHSCFQNRWQKSFTLFLKSDSSLRLNTFEIQSLCKLGPQWVLVVGSFQFAKCHLSSTSVVCVLKYGPLLYFIFYKTTN